MYLTFFTKPQYKQYTIDDILKDPYLQFNQIPNTPQKKVTVECTEEYGRELYNKRWLGEKLPDMAWTDELNPNEEYTHWNIPKKNGGYRPIDGPSDKLKAAQEIYKSYIEDTLHVLNHKCAHAYTKERSIVTNAEAHKRNESKWMLKIDFSNFFGSIDENWLKTMLLQVYPFRFIPKEHFERIVRLSLLNGVLPQGSKLSPTLTNIVMVPIDKEICETLHNYKKHHYVYTRYADDIAISCKEKFDTQEIIEIIKDILNKWNTPFSINPAKTRFTSANGANYLCGININYNKITNETKLTAGHEKNNKFRAMINNFCQAGEYWNPHDIQKMLGIISYYKSFEKEFVLKVINKYNNKYNIDLIKKANMILNGTYNDVTGLTDQEIDTVIDAVIPF